MSLISLPLHSTILVTKVQKIGFTIQKIGYTKDNHKTQMIKSKDKDKEKMVVGC